ncbi:MAG TPA: bifunctional 4-hydroxy-2-oxoglutarate aldolase/2-dehydro-3-deoxy-phosphogluconate aldolase [Pseudomonadales bacterium]|nr:bifunctional 4-hydroxy-2-oxoglutarate aldolase/2-dehydro-3-deoxy-phosphogluconate aldolase [Pseudomonadales bacterium]
MTEPTALDAGELERLLRRAVAVPVVALDRVDDAVPLARTLANTGLQLVEITLRTAAGLPAIRAIRAANVPLTVAAGTIRTPADLVAARDAGAAFAISPGATRALIDAARATGFAWLPGAATPSEMLTLADAGHSLQKLFPASLDLVDALAGPFPDIRVVPTGGVDIGNAGEYLKRRSVVAVSGSWIAPRALIAERAWPEIERRARSASAFAQAVTRSLASAP